MSRKRYVTDNLGALRTLVVDHGRTRDKSIKKKRVRKRNARGFSGSTPVGKRR